MLEAGVGFDLTLTAAIGGAQSFFEYLPISTGKVSH